MVHRPPHVSPDTWFKELALGAFFEDQGSQALNCPAPPHAMQDHQVHVPTRRSLTNLIYTSVRWRLRSPAESLSRIRSPGLAISPLLVHLLNNSLFQTNGSGLILNYIYFLRTTWVWDVTSTAHSFAWLTGRTMVFSFLSFVWNPQVAYDLNDKAKVSLKQVVEFTLALVKKLNLKMARTGKHTWKNKVSQNYISGNSCFYSRFALCR